MGLRTIPESVTISTWESPYLANACVSWATSAVGGGRFSCASAAEETLPSLRPAGTLYGLPPVCRVCKHNTEN
jgi:hypothetical protein